ncbi:putative o-spanin [Mesorhizobium phage Cp1R7A-A1]|nr:putative o-spanin [Mesorhizobium phage Cp1R7A-A1]
MLRLKAMGRLLLCCVMPFVVLSACTTTRTDIQLIAPTIPDALRSCRDVPGFPKEPYSQKDVARFLNSLAGAHLDCKEKLAGVISILDKSAAAQKAKLQKKK